MPLFVVLIYGRVSCKLRLNPSQSELSGSQEQCQLNVSHLWVSLLFYYQGHILCIVKMSQIPAQFLNVCIHPAREGMLVLSPMITAAAGTAYDHWTVVL